MIPAFHDYRLEPKITKCGDLLYKYNKQLVKKKWGRIVDLAWLMFALTALISIEFKRILVDSLIENVRNIQTTSLSWNASSEKATVQSSQFKGG